VRERKAMLAVVDDDTRLLESLEELFESAGYNVRTYASAKALIDAGLSDIDCLVSDIGMPSMDGFDLLDAVKRERPDLPVFLITGRHEIADQERANLNDISGFFRKPFNGRTLLAAVGDALRA
jgi:FixJ family two-component response regulator